MKKKQIVIATIVVAIVVLMTTMLVACNGNAQQQPGTPEVEQPPKHEHNYVFVEAKEPTCVDSGYVAHYTCECGKYFNLSKHEVDYIKDVYLANTLQHDYGEWIPEGDFVCGDATSAHRICKTCGDRDTTDRYVVPLPHTWGDDGFCEVCGTKKPKEWQVVDGKIECGEYPQSRADGEIEAVLTAGCTAPSKGNSAGWTDYGYYYSSAVQEFMWFKDVTHDGERYRGVYFTEYRPSSAMGKANEDGSYQDDNGYQAGVMYWFKFEPIVWNVIKDNNGEMMLVSAVILDNQFFYHSIAARTSDSGEIYANNYAESDIRTWLNDEFFEWAFDDEAKEIIQKTEVDNGPDQGKNHKDFPCANVTDNVFLLSDNEVLALQDKSIAADEIAPTDYACCQGAQVQEKNMTDVVGAGIWLTRSPGGTKNDVHEVKKGNLSYNTFPIMLLGIVPAITIKL